MSISVSVEDMQWAQSAFEKLKSKMSDVLTQEQKKRMSGLIENPPEFVKKMLDKAADTGSGDWSPGPNSWKPGDPLPMLPRATPKRRFPGRETPDEEQGMEQ